jgi:hypothetical protein
MMKKIETIAYWVVLSIMLIVTVGVAKDSWGDEDEGPQPEALIGDRAGLFSLATIEGNTVAAVLAKGDELLIFFRSDCQFCQASMKFYREIAVKKCDLRMVFVTAEPTGLAQFYWNDHGWDVDETCATEVVGSAYDTDSVQVSYNIPGTPTHYSVTDGSIVQAGVGSLGPGSVKRQISEFGR